MRPLILAATVLAATVLAATMLAGCEQKADDTPADVPIFPSQRADAQDTAAMADVCTIGKEVALWFNDHTAMPLVTQPDGVGEPYLLGADADSMVSIGNASANVLLGGDGITGTKSTDWCVFVTNAQGDKAIGGFQYSAVNGLKQGNCTTP